jgi:energy-coupling factor transport system permease protein
MMFSLALSLTELFPMILTLAVIVALAAASKILTRLARTLVFTTIFAVVIFIVNSAVGFPLEAALVLASRFIAIVAATSTFFLATSPDELEYVMKWFRLPQDLVFAFVTAVRFVPVLMLDAMQIIDAQRSRGLELDRGNFLKRARKLTPILIPLVVNAVLRSGELAEAMEARAYGAAPRPTSLYTLKLRRVDKITTAIAVILFGTAIYAFIFRAIP